MLPRLTELKITTMHCEHLSTHLVTGDGREDALVRPGYKLLVMILNISTMVYTQLTVKLKIVLYDGRCGNSNAHIVGVPPDDDETGDVLY